MSKQVDIKLVNYVLLPQVVYDVSKLTALSQELENVVDSRKFSEAYEVKRESGPKGFIVIQPTTFLHRLLFRG